MHCTSAASSTAANCCGRSIPIRPAVPQGPLIFARRALRSAHSNGLRLNRKGDLGDGWCTNALAGGASIQGEFSPSNEERTEFSKDILRRILTFMGPAILIPLGDPLMSLVDTVCIGQFCDSASLAAMGPANMIKSFATYIFQSLQVATLSLVASNLRDKQRDIAARTLSTALMMAAAFGLLTTVLLSASASPIVRATGVQDVQLLPMATDYLRIRAVAQPAVLATMVAQAGLLAQQDSVTPSLSVAISVFISIVGNLVFVLGLGYGLHGAGVTTVATQMSGALILLWALHSRKSQLQPHWSVPRPQELITLTQMMVPLTVVSMSKNLCYLCVSTTAATLRTLCLAAHQAAFTVWCLGTWSTSPLEQAGMTFLPSAEKPWQRKLIGDMVMGLGCIVAAVTGSMLFGLLQFGPGVLVRDLQVQQYMQQIAPQGMISLALVGIDVAATAVVLACKDTTYMARSHLVTLAGICVYFWQCRAHAWGLSGVWWGVVLFFLLRAGQSSLRALWLLRSNHVLEAVGSESADNGVGQPSAAASFEESTKSKEGSNGQPQAAHEVGLADAESGSDGWPARAGQIEDAKVTQNMNGRPLDARDTSREVEKNKGEVDNSRV